MPENAPHVAVTAPKIKDRVKLNPAGVDNGSTVRVNGKEKE